MKRSLLIVGALALAGAGVWLGRATSASSSRPPQPTVAAPAQVVAPSTPLAQASRARAPQIARPATAAELPEVAADLADAEPRVRAAAARELAENDSPDPALLRTAVRDSDPSVAALALRGLGKLHASGAIGADEMIGYARDTRLDERVRVVAYNSLGVVPSRAAAEFLAESLVRGTSMIEKRSAAVLLQHQDPAIAMPALIAALADADEGVRQLALESLRARSRGRDFGTDAAAWRAWWQSRSR